MTICSAAVIFRLGPNPYFLGAGVYATSIREIWVLVAVIRKNLHPLNNYHLQSYHGLHQKR